MSKINFKPTRDWLVLPLKRENQTEAGILLTEATANALRTNILDVLACGPDCAMVKVGDTVMVHPSTEGLIVNIDDQDCVMVSESFICGIIPS
tara:strand:- start:134 stop:412 length:279 start_codon:yes stop_codon:yes gene_type:complete